MKNLLLALIGFFTLSNPDCYSLNRQDSDLNFSLSTNYEHGFDTGIDSGGEFSISRYSVNASLRSNLSQTLGLDANGEYSLLDFNFSTPNGFAGLNPWDSINTASLGFRLTYDINPKFAITAGPQITHSGEQGADFSESLTYSGLAGFTYSPSRSLLLGTGVYITSRIEDDLIAYPGFIMNWFVNNKLMISTLITGIKSDPGPKIRASYNLTNNIDAAINMGYQTNRFRLDSTGIAPNGVGDVKVLPVWASLGFNLSKNLLLEIYSGLGLWGKLELEDENGDRIDKKHFDTILFIGCGLRLNI